MMKPADMKMNLVSEWSTGLANCELVLVCVVKQFNVYLSVTRLYFERLTGTGTGNNSFSILYLFSFNHNYFNFMHSH